jgi:hypothetical protein
MFRKLILAAVLATGTLVGLSATAGTAEAAPIRHQHRFEVLVERGHGWHNRGTYRTRIAAERAAQHLRHQGFRVQIRGY